MNKTDCCEKIRMMVEPLLAAQGLVLWGIELVYQGKQCVRVFIDTPPSAKKDDEPKANGDLPNSDFLDERASAALDQCEAIARDLGLALEVEDLFSDAWVLEVSSPGLDRTFFTLDQMRSYIGDVVEAKLSQSVPAEGGARFWRGILRSVSDDAFALTPVSITDEDCVQVASDSALVTLPWSMVQRVHRRALFPKPAKPGKARKS